MKTIIHDLGEEYDSLLKVNVTILLVRMESMRLVRGVLDVGQSIPRNVS